MAHKEKSQKQELKEKLAAGIAAVVKENSRWGSKKINKAIKESSKLLVKAILKSAKEAEKKKGGAAKSKS